MTRRASIILNNMEVVMSTLISILEKIKQRGLSEDFFYRLATPEGNAILEHFVDIIAEHDSVHVLIDYNRALLCKAEDCGLEDNGVKLKLGKFPLQKTGKGVKDINIIFSYFKTSELIGSDVRDAMREMSTRGYRPVTAGELLSLAICFPRLGVEFPIFALGSIYVDSNCSESVMCITRKGLGWSIKIPNLDYDSHANTKNKIICFAVTRK